MFFTPLPPLSLAKSWHLTIHIKFSLLILTIKRVLLYWTQCVNAVVGVLDF